MIETGFSDSYKFGEENDLPSYDQCQSPVNGFRFEDPLVDLSFMNSSLCDSASDDGDFGDDSVLNYINHILMEEDIDDKSCMFHDALALQAAENSLYQALTTSVDQKSIHSPEGSGCASDYGSDGGFNTNASNSGDDNINRGFGHFGERRVSLLCSPLHDNFVFQSPPLSISQSRSSDDDFVCMFKRGVEEARKFLPKPNQLVIDLENMDTAAPRNFRGNGPKRTRDSDLEDERSHKQSAVYVDEGELSEMFDRVLLFNIRGKGKQMPRSRIVEEDFNDGLTKYVLEDGKTLYVLENEKTKSLQQSGKPSSGIVHGKRRGGYDKKEVVDLSTQLILCAQAVSADDLATVNQLLKQIRRHSSPFGDGSQRLAHCFANALEARLAGTGTQLYASLASKPTSASEMLKAYRSYISACPFKKIAYIFANNNILNLAEKASALHVIDFGISYGFQWPALISRLAARPGGPPRLRITGIELPQPGFRPEDRAKETGRRLARYCERFKVPFHYTAIAQKWETITIEDINIDANEVTAVNSMFRLKNLLDDTIMPNSPRTAVLELIRRVKPDVFVHGIVNGSYNAPFFVTRFKEALFNYSALFDVLDSNLPREDAVRVVYEREVYGREVVNVVACEGRERVERPETYRQWQGRSARAGFRQLPLNASIVKKVKGKVKAAYHDEFMVDEDGGWMLQGWKGRVVYASSCWVPL